MKLRALAPGKVNLGLVLGPVRADGRHELHVFHRRRKRRARLVAVLLGFALLSFGLGLAR